MVECRDATIRLTSSTNRTFLKISTFEIFSQFRSYICTRGLIRFEKPCVISLCDNNVLEYSVAVRLTWTKNQVYSND